MSVWGRPRPHSGSGRSPLRTGRSAHPDAAEPWEVRGRVAGGGYPPPAPTDPDMRNSRIRLLGSWIRYAYAHPRAAVSDDSPPAVGLALRRWLARWPVRLSARQPMIRSAASLRRVPWGRFPDFSGTTSELRLLAARPASLLHARRYHGFTLFAPAGAGTPPGPGRTCMAAVRGPRLRWRRRDLPGSWATPACMPRSSTPAEPPAPGQSRRRRWCLPQTSRRRLPRSERFRGSITRPARLPVYASQPGSPPDHATLGSGWLACLGRSGLSPAGSLRRFPSCQFMYFPLHQALPGARRPRPHSRPPCKSQAEPGRPAYLLRLQSAASR